MNAIPWYKSRILQGLLTIFVSQALLRIQARFHIDFSVWGTRVTDIVSALMDGISMVALYWSAHARVATSVPIPPVVTLTKSAAETINGSKA